MCTVNIDYLEDASQCEEESSLHDMLKKHVYDMDVHELRAVLSQAGGPAETTSCKYSPLSISVCSHIVKFIVCQLLVCLWTNVLFTLLQMLFSILGNKKITLNAFISAKEERRNWYRQDNIPEWWLSTGLPFISVNHPKGTFDLFYLSTKIDRLILPIMIKYNSKTIF